MRKNKYSVKLLNWYALVGQKGKKAKTALSPAHRLREIAELEAELAPHLPPFRQGQKVGDVTVRKVTTTELPLVDVASGKPLPNCWAVGHEYQVTDGEIERWAGERFLIKRREATNG